MIIIGVYLLNKYPQYRNNLLSCNDIDFFEMENFTRLIDTQTLQLFTKNNELSLAKKPTRSRSFFNV